MNDRLKEIFSLIPECSVFSDIGCDHGYISQMMIESGKCSNVIISDISRKCLKKAEILLAKQIEKGNVKSFVSDGYKGLPESDCSLIAGMGGEECISILKGAKSLPNTIVFQPMRNVDKLRRYLVNNGFKILRDYTFYADKKFYEILLAKKGKDELTEDEILFGRENLIVKGDAFIKKIKIQIETNKKILANPKLSEEARFQLERETERFIKCLK